MLGLGPYPYKPRQGKTEDLYNRAWGNQKATIKRALDEAMKFDRIGKKAWSKDYYSAVSYIYFIMNYANIIVQRIDFIVSTEQPLDIDEIRAQFKTLCIIESLPCISNCKGVNLRTAFTKIFRDFGIEILTNNKEVPFCPGIGRMVINSATLDEAFIVGSSECIEGDIGEYDEEEYDNNEYTTS